MKKKLTLLIIIISIFFGLATPKVSQAACLPGIAISGVGLTAQGFSLVDCTSIVLTSVLVPVTGYLVKTSAELFDFALDKNLKLGQFVNSASPNALSPVETIWKIIRDLSGMFFIFILIYASIQTILNGANAKNTIVGVVTGAVLVNFSLFFTKLVVDFSNTISLTIYTAIVPNGTNTISEVISSVVELQSLLIASQTAARSINFGISTIVTLTGALSLMLIIAIMFLAGAVMFLWRFVMLIGLMAFSPFWAISQAIPSPEISKYGKEYISKLTSQAVFAPVFLFFIYVGLKVVTDSNFIKIIDPNNKNLGGIFDTAATNVIGPLFQYGLAIFIMFTGLAMAVKLGGKGGEFGLKWMEGLGKWGMGVVSGTSRGLTRNTVSRVSSMVANSDFIQDRAGKGFAGKMVLTNLRSAAKPYEENIKKQAKDRVEFAKSLGSNGSKIATYQKDIEENMSYLDKYKIELTNPTISASRKKELDTFIKQLETSNKELKNKVSAIKNEREASYIKNQDPTLNTKTGERRKKSILERITISASGAETATLLGVKNLEKEVGDKEKKVNEAKDKKNQSSKDLNKVRDDLKKRSVAESDYYKDPLYKEKADKLHNDMSDFIKNEAELRVLKSTKDKLKGDSIS